MGSSTGHDRRFQPQDDELGKERGDKGIRCTRCLNIAYDAAYISSAALRSDVVRLPSFFDISLRVI